MKLNKIFSGMMLAAVLVACTQQEQAIPEPMVATGAATYDMPAEGGEIELTFTSNMPWKITVAPGNAKSEVGDIKVTPSSGIGSERPIVVTVKARANAGSKRVAIISILGTGFEAAVKLNQAGQGDSEVQKGTWGTPYKASELAALVKGGDAPLEPVYVTGIISKLVDMSVDYGNVTYFISDDGTEADDSFEIFRGKLFGGASYTADDTELLKVGTTVVVLGESTLYKDTPEFKAGNILITADGKALPGGEGTAESPFNVAKARELVEGGTAPSDEVYVKAVIVQIDNVNLGYGNAQYWLADDHTTTYMMEVYRGFWFGGANFEAEDQIKVGDVVMVKGKIKDYKGTTEFDAGNQIVELNGKTE